MATSTTSTIEKAWQEQIVDQLGDDALNGDAPDATHCAILIATDEQHALLLGRAESETAAIVLGEDRAHGLSDQERGDVGPDAELRVLRLDDVYRWHRAHDTGAPEPELDGPMIEPQRQNVETDEPEEVDVDEDEPEETPAPASLDANRSGDGKQLFDASQYDREDLQIPKIDGQSIDRISVKFAGEIHLDRSDPSDVQLYNALRFGKDVQLLVEARCNSTGAKGATDRDGDLDVVVGTKGIKVHSLMKPAGADWVGEPEAESESAA